MIIPGIGAINKDQEQDFISLLSGGDGIFNVGRESVKMILTPLDRKVEFIIYENKTLVYVKSEMGNPALYPLQEASFASPAKAVLMDLDGTSVRSEEFWIWIIEKTVSSLILNQKFSLEETDILHVSGHSVSEHLQYCIGKYCPEKSVEEARTVYFNIVNFEMNEIMKGRGRGRTDAFKPAPGLKDFLMELKGSGIKVGLVTSGLYEKAWPEIVSAFKTINLGNPLHFYDAIITAGTALKKGQAGTLGELAPKPHPWLYSEAARIGLGISPEQRNSVLGIEDSAAGVVSLRLAGFAAVGIEGGNISSSGVDSLLCAKYPNLTDMLPLILETKKS